MFSKPSKESTESSSVPQQPPQSQPQPQQQQQPVPPGAAAKKPVRANGVPSIFSAEIVISGMIISSGDLQVDGRIEGDVRACSLIIGDKATIVGDVYAEEATIRGRVEGGISARKVQLAATCHVSGNILHQSLSVEAGAFFEGNCRHSDNPLADAPETVTTPPRREPRKLAPLGGKSSDGDGWASPPIAAANS